VERCAGDKTALAVLVSPRSWENLEHAQKLLGHATRDMTEH
jgi:hypothetical protein